MREVVILAPSLNEDLTQAIAMQVCESTGATFTRDESFNVMGFPLVIELGGILDRGPEDMMVEDKTRTQIAASAFSQHFTVSTKPDFLTPMSKRMKSNYFRVEMTGRVRYSEVMRAMVVRILEEIIREVGACVKVESVDAAGAADSAPPSEKPVAAAAAPAASEEDKEKGNATKGDTRKQD